LVIREELRSRAARCLKAGGPAKADLLLVETAQGPIVVKDFAAKSWLTRQLGRVQISRECKAYHWLGPLPGLPRFLGRVDAHALALAWIEGDPLVRAVKRFPDRQQLLARLQDVMRGLHAAGLAHLDLRGRENVMLGPGGEIYVLDLAGAVWFRPGSLAHRLFFRWFWLTDQAALLKWKALLGAGPYTPQEQAFLDRYRFWRVLWPFNRKPRSPSKRSP
jgi:hypothetical protein